MHTLWRQNNIQLQLLRRCTSRSLVLAHARVNLVQRSEVDHQVVLNSEDGICLEPWVVVGIDLGDYGLVIVVGDLE